MGDADAIIAITTANGSLDLTGADYKLFYSGRQSPSPSKQPSQPNTSSATKPPSPTSASKAGNDEDDLLYATITALQSNRIVAKIEPSTGGVDQREAFLALKRDVERMLEGWLQVRWWSFRKYSWSRIDGRTPPDSCLLSAVTLTLKLTLIMTERSERQSPFHH